MIPGEMDEWGARGEDVVLKINCSSRACLSTEGRIAQY